MSSTRARRPHPLMPTTGSSSTGMVPRRRPPTMCAAWTRARAGTAGAATTTRVPPDIGRNPELARFRCSTPAHRQLDHEACAAGLAALAADLAAVGLDDLLRDGEAEAVAVALGREERLEQVLARLVVHAAAA